MTELPRWLEVGVRAPAEWSELVAERLAERLGGGVAFGAPSLASEPVPPGLELVRAYATAWVEPHEVEERVRGVLAELARDAGLPELLDLEVRARALPPEDFASSWEKRWKPFRVGRLAIVAPGSTRALRPGDRALWLEPGGAFGTGRHTTTRACLRVIQQRITGGERVLDAGAGNAVLSVAALLLGARRALAFDNDPHALPYAAKLARDNGVDGRCELRTGGFELLGAADRDFDAVFANIYADLIQRHAADLAARLAPTGWFVFSGCHRDHRDGTEAALAAAGLAIEGRTSTGRWDTYQGRPTRPARATESTQR